EQGVVAQAMAVTLTEPSGLDDAQSEKFSRRCGLAVHSQRASVVLNDLPRLVEGGSQDADFLGIEDAPVDVSFKTVEHRPLLDRAVLPSRQDHSAPHPWKRVVALTDAPGIHSAELTGALVPSTCPYLWRESAKVALRAISDTPLAR